MLIAVVAVLGYRYCKFIVPAHRVPVRSELIVLGDLDGVKRWTDADVLALDAFAADPFKVSDWVARRMNINQNGLIDAEDVRSRCSAGVVLQRDMTVDHVKFLRAMPLHVSS